MDQCKQGSSRACGGIKVPVEHVALLMNLGMGIRDVAFSHGAQDAQNAPTGSNCNYPWVPDMALAHVSQRSMLGTIMERTLFLLGGRDTPYVT